MAKLLQVFLNQLCVGTLTQKVSGMSFRYCADWLTSSACMPLSLSLPLQEATFSYKACRKVREFI